VYVASLFRHTSLIVEPSQQAEKDDGSHRVQGLLLGPQRLRGTQKVHAHGQRLLQGPHRHSDGASRARADVLKGPEQDESALAEAVQGVPRRLVGGLAQGIIYFGDLFRDKCFPTCFISQCHIQKNEKRKDI
jgi:hypothetical protein